MNYRAAFIESICAAPHDDAPRLVFADWLEDQGQADRADFVRCQVRLAGVGDTCHRPPAQPGRRPGFRQTEGYPRIS